MIDKCLPVHLYEIEYNTSSKGAHSLMLHLTDVDECLSGTHDCATTAKCSNSDGSFSCVCNKGYSGGGVTCTGKIVVILCSRYDVFCRLKGDRKNFACGRQTNGIGSRTVLMLLEC